MTAMSKKLEYGDFQTPMGLTTQVCQLLRRKGAKPASVIEPTCGRGSFILASLRTFDSLSEVIGVEYNADYVHQLSDKLRDEPRGQGVQVRQGDFFQQKWDEIIASAPKPVLLLGNPPWVTNATLGKLNGTNLPKKSNFQGHRGFDALTGKSNFDISEWMLIHLLEWARDGNVVTAFLCKTAVARKVILHRWKHNLKPYRFSIYRFDARKHFNASVDACLFVAERSAESRDKTCCVYEGIEEPSLESRMGIRGNSLIADVDAFDDANDLQGESAYVWRSGIKHDCSKVMELIPDVDGSFRNKLGERVDIEDAFLYPLLKSSDVSKGSTEPRRYVLVPQRTTGEDTSPIQKKAPRTWKYLNAHADLLNGRASSIYRNRPPFSIFGIGPYSFSPWKVAISGLYKSLTFTIVGPVEERPVMLDDTCYFVPCQTEAEARLLKKLLDEERATKLFTSYIFWDDKRPIKVELLEKLDLLELAKQMGVDRKYMRYVSYNPYTEPRKRQLSLIREGAA